jgi:hypothetical protein
VKAARCETNTEDSDKDDDNTDEHARDQQECLEPIWPEECEQSCTLIRINIETHTSAAGAARQPVCSTGGASGVAAGATR